MTASSPDVAPIRFSRMERAKLLDGAAAKWDRGDWGYFVFDTADNGECLIAFGPDDDPEDDDPLWVVAKQGTGEICVMKRNTMIVEEGVLFDDVLERWRRENRPVLSSGRCAASGR